MFVNCEGKNLDRQLADLTKQPAQNIFQSKGYKFLCSPLISCSTNNNNSRGQNIGNEGKVQASFRVRASVRVRIREHQKWWIRFRCVNLSSEPCRGNESASLAGGGNYLLTPVLPWAAAWWIPVTSCLCSQHPTFRKPLCDDQSIKFQRIKWTRLLVFLCCGFMLCCAWEWNDALSTFQDNPNLQLSLRCSLLLLSIG